MIVAAEWSESIADYFYTFVVGQYAYTHTIRKPKKHGQVIEVKTQLTQRDYLNMVSQRDEAHFPIFKKRRCFIYKNQYFQLDIYREPCHPRWVASTTLEVEIFRFFILDEYKLVFIEGDVKISTISSRTKNLIRLIASHHERARER